MSDGSGADLVEVLAWDSEFWGFRIARATFDVLTPGRVQEVDTWCLAHDVCCLYFLARSDDDSTPRVAEAWGCRFVDIRITYKHERTETPLGSAMSPGALVTIRSSCPEDVSSLGNISRQSYQDSRFYYDQGFPRDHCDALYETWATNSCRGYADEVLVAELADGLAGFVTCHVDRQYQVGRVGLVGVSQRAQGRGLGQKLVKEALHWFWRQGVREVTVVTQGRNIPAQRLYQRCGFLTYSVELWYHKWYDTVEAVR